jgi:tetratricopeptide (TPR) repeat protein
MPHSFVQRALTAALISLVILAPTSRAQEDVPEIARTLLEEAQHARETRHLDDAIAKYRRVIEVAPQLASPYIDLGALLHDQGKTDEAYKVFVQGIESARPSRVLLSNAAATALEIGKSSDALTYVDRAIEMNQRDAALYALRGTVLRALKRDDEATAALQHAVQLAPNDARAYFSLGNALYATGHKDESIAAYRKAVELDPSLTRAYYNLGAVLFDLGRDSEALGAYKVALEPIDRAFARNEPVDRIHARAYSNLGAIYLRQKQWQSAIDAYNKALKLDPSSANTHYNLGFILYNTNKFDRAEEEYRKALSIDVALPLAYLHLAQIAMKKNDSAGAAKLLRDGLPRFDAETKPVALRTLGRLELAIGSSAAAVDALKQNTNDVDSAVLLARIDRREKRFDDAAKLLDAATSDSPAVLLGRAMLARDTNDLPREQSALEALIAKHPRPEFRVALGINYARQGRFDDAQKYLAGTKSVLTAALQRDVKQLLDFANDPIARGDAGLLLWTNKRGDEAKPHLAAALTAQPAWGEVALALGDIALASRDYARASEMLAVAEAHCAPPVDVLLIGATENLCARAKHDLALALISEATTSRQGRPLVDRAAQLDSGLAGAAAFLRGNFDLAAGSDDDAREAFTRTLDIGIPDTAEALAKKYLAEIAQNAEAAKAPEPASESSASTPRRTVVVFLPDVPAENEKKLFETMSSFVSQLSSSSGVQLSVEFFRRADDAREFIAANRERVGVVISNPEFTSGFASQFQFAREGQRTYRRVLIVPSSSAAKSPADLRGRSLSLAEGLRDVSGSGANVVQAADDLTAAANALTGKADAALVAESNTVLAQNRARFRVIYTSGATPLPVIAFAAMPQADREALTTTLRSMSGTKSLAPLQVSGLVSLEREATRPTAKKIEVATISPRDLGIVAPEPPPPVALRATLPPSAAIAEEMFDTP